MKIRKSLQLLTLTTAVALPIANSGCQGCICYLNDINEEVMNQDRQRDYNNVHQTPEPSSIGLLAAGATTIGLYEKE